MFLIVCDGSTPKVMVLPVNVLTKMRMVLLDIFSPEPRPSTLESLFSSALLILFFLLFSLFEIGFPQMFLGIFHRRGVNDDNNWRLACKNLRMTYCVRSISEKSVSVIKHSVNIVFANMLRLYALFHFLQIQFDNYVIF